MRRLRSSGAGRALHVGDDTGGVARAVVLGSDTVPEDCEREAAVGSVSANHHTTHSVPVRNSRNNLHRARQRALQHHSSSTERHRAVRSCSQRRRDHDRSYSICSRSRTLQGRVAADVVFAGNGGLDGRVHLGERDTVLLEGGGRLSVLRSEALAVTAPETRNAINAQWVKYGVVHESAEHLHPTGKQQQQCSPRAPRRVELDLHGFAV